MRNQITVWVAMLALCVLLGTGCGSDNNGPVGSNPVDPTETDDDIVETDSTIVTSVETVISPLQCEYLPASQAVTVSCVSYSSDTVDLSTTWSSNCGIFDRTDTSAVQWIAPDTNAQAEIIASVTDGQRHAADTLRLTIFNSNTWALSYNLGTYEDGQDVLRTQNGEYIVLVSHGMVRLAKIRSNGSLIWDKDYSLCGSFWARAVTEMPDGGYTITGSRRIIDGTMYIWDVFLLRVDSEGNLLWHKILGDGNSGTSYDLVCTPDGGLLITGSVSSIYGANVSLMRTDADGNLKWQKTYPGRVGKAIISTSDGRYAITGQIGAPASSGFSDTYLLKVDVEGNVIFQNIYGDDDGQLSFAVVETPGGGFAVAGQSHSTSTDLLDGYLFLTDPVGNLIKWTAFGGDDDDLVRDLVVRPKGGFAVAGYTESFGAGYYDLYLLSFDANGNMEWQKAFGGTSLEEGQALVNTPDGGLLVVGRTMSFSADLCDLYVVKTDELGRVWTPPLPQLKPVLADPWQLLADWHVDYPPATDPRFQ